MPFHRNYNELGAHWSYISSDKKGRLSLAKLKLGVIKKKRLILTRACLKLMNVKIDRPLKIILCS